MLSPQNGQVVAVSSDSACRSNSFPGMSAPREATSRVVWPVSGSHRTSTGTVAGSDEPGGTIRARWVSLRRSSMPPPAS